MIYVFIRVNQSPTFWICAKVSFHIFMNLFLQINPKLSICPDNHISTNTTIGRNITIRVVDRKISLVIQDIWVNQ